MNLQPFKPRIPPAALAPIADVDPAQVTAIMEKVRQIELRTRGLVAGSMAGGYRAAFRGRGIDFDNVREYMPGDEVRTIDWNVTARTGHPFVKQFREERELTLMLLVDVSGSGDFGSTAVRKRERAAELACVLAMSAIKNRDQVGCILFSDQIERFVPVGKGRSHALRVVRELLGCSARSRGTDLAAAIRFAGQIQTKRSLMFVISDLELGGIRATALEELQRALRPVARAHDVVTFHVRDPHERELPDVGLVTVQDAETGEVVAIDTSRQRVRTRFAERARERTTEITTLLRRDNVEVCEIDTAASYVPTLMDLFAGRERRQP